MTLWLINTHWLIDYWLIIDWLKSLSVTWSSQISLMFLWMVSLCSCVMSNHLSVNQTQGQCQCVSTWQVSHRSNTLKWHFMSPDLIHSLSSTVDAHSLGHIFKTTHQDCNTWLGFRPDQFTQCRSHRSLPVCLSVWRSLIRLHFNMSTHQSWRTDDTELTFELNTWFTGFSWRLFFCTFIF